MSDEKTPQEYTAEAMAGSIGCWPPPEQGTFDLPVPGLFSTNDRKVLNWNGNNYYRACQAVVERTADGGWTFCVKPEGHSSKIHEAIDGKTREFPDYQFELIGLEEAVNQALGVATLCWEHPENAGVFDSDRLADLAEQLMKRIVFGGKRP